jgi:uncharacterized protein
MRAWSIRRVAVAVLLLGCLGVWAGEPVTGDSARHCLWRVRAESNTVYLLGSIHLLKAENYPLSPVITRAFDESRVLVLETDLGRAKDPAVQMEMLSAGLLGPSNSLERVLQPETYALVRQRTQEMGLDLKFFTGFKPWYFVTVLALVKLQKLGFDPMEGVDWHFYRRAQAQDKKVLGLETVAYQLGLFDSIDATAQDALVRQSLEDFDIVETEMSRIDEAWRTGNVVELEQTLLKSFKDYPELRAIFLTRRNKLWLSQIEAFLKSPDRHFVVVGAGHLAGDENLVKLLEQKGYKVEQMRKRECRVSGVACRGGRGQMSLATVRWGVLGCGGIARALAKGVAASRTGTLVAAVSRSMDKARTFAAEFGVPTAHGSYEALLADGAVDAVYVATPHPMHVEWVVKCAAAGKHILGRFARQHADAGPLAPGGGLGVRRGESRSSRLAGLREPMNRFGQKKSPPDSRRALCLA